VEGTRRWKAVALLASGIAIGVVMVGTPAGAHVAGWTHNWNKHIKPKADKRYQKIPTGTQHYTIAGSALVADDGTRADVFVSGSGDTNLGWCYTGGNFYAEIHLPHGAKITGLTVDYRDDSGTTGSNGSVYVTRMPLKGKGGSYSDIIYSQLLNTAVAGDQASAAGSFLNAPAQVVNNARHVYNVIAQGVAADAAVCGIDIRYSVKAPFAAARVAPAAGAQYSSRP
jgi:hypothetical protein